MARVPDDDCKETSKVVPISALAAVSMATTLEETFREKRDALVQYLRSRIGSEGDAQDIAQAAFLRLWEKRDRLHSKNVASLLFVAARNIANDLLRTRKRHRDWTADTSIASTEMSDGCESPERIVTGRNNLEIIRTILAELPDKCRSAFVSYKFNGLEYEDLARNMGITESMVRKHVLRAVAHCAARFSEMEEWV